MPEGVVCVRAVFGHTTSTQRSADVCWKGTPQPTERTDQSANVSDYSDKILGFLAIHPNFGAQTIPVTRSITQAGRQ